MKLPFSLPSEIFRMVITFIQADTEKVQLDLNGPSSVFTFMYVMILNGKLHRSKN